MSATPEFLDCCIIPSAANIHAAIGNSRNSQISARQRVGMHQRLELGGAMNRSLCPHPTGGHSICPLISVPNVPIHPPQITSASNRLSFGSQCTWALLACVFLAKALAVL